MGSNAQQLGNVQQQIGGALKIIQLVTGLLGGAAAVLGIMSMS